MSAVFASLVPEGSLIARRRSVADSTVMAQHLTRVSQKLVQM